MISLDYEASEITQEENHSQRPVDIQRCLHAGVLPACLANGNIRIEVQEESAMRMYGSNEYPLQPIPSNGTTSRNLNNFGKLSRAEKPHPKISRDSHTQFVKNGRNPRGRFLLVMPKSRKKQ